MVDEPDPGSASQVPADEDPKGTPDPAAGETHGTTEPAPEASPTETITERSRPHTEPPSGSAAVAAETAPAQITEGSSNEVDTVPVPEPEAPVYRQGMFGVHGTGDTSGYGGLQRRVPVTPGAQPPFGGWFDDAHAALAEVVPGWDDAVEKVTLDRGELTYHVRRESLLDVLRGLRDDPSLRFELLSMVGGVHYPDDPAGRQLHSVYQLTSLTYRRRIRVEVAVSDGDPHLPSATSIYPTADWQEREAYDMYGLLYDGHPGLTRILMPDDWEGHPQRKDYPLGGIPVTYKGASIPPPDTRRAYS